MERLVEVLQAAPQLEAVEVLGAPAHAAGTLLAAWQEVQQRRGAQGCTVPVAGEPLRLGRVVG